DAEALRAVGKLRHFLKKCVKPGVLEVRSVVPFWGEIATVKEEEERLGVGVIGVPAGAAVHLERAPDLAILKIWPRVLNDFASDAELLELLLIKLRALTADGVHRDDIELEDEGAAGSGIDAVGIPGL